MKQPDKLEEVVISGMNQEAANTIWTLARYNYTELPTTKKKDKQREHIYNICK